MGDSETEKYTMRNILEYPVTHEEKVELLKLLIKKDNEKPIEEIACGDMTGYILNEILKDIESLKK